MAESGGYAHGPNAFRMPFIRSVQISIGHHQNLHEINPQLLLNYIISCNVVTITFFAKFLIKNLILFISLYIHIQKINLRAYHGSGVSKPSQLYCECIY